MERDMLWHSLEVEVVLSKLGANLKTGLSQDEVHKRQKIFGPNELPQVQDKPLLSIFFNQFLSPLIYLLLITAMITFTLGERKDSLMIVLVVLINSIIGTYQEHQAEHSLKGLRKLAKFKARVLRQGEEQVIEGSEIVPGDILFLNAGDAVSADARILEAFQFSVSEGALTGESCSVEKHSSPTVERAHLFERKNMIYAGTYIQTGKCLAVVTATGLNNELGKIAQLASNIARPLTKLEEKIKKMGNSLAIFSVFVFLTVVLVGLIRGIPFSNIFLIAVGQMVSIVPEGLPVAMTIALSLGVQRMARRGTIVRRLSAVETLGATSVICADKTGTLTQNKMTVTTIYLPSSQEWIDVKEDDQNTLGKFYSNGKALNPRLHKNLMKLVEASVLCNDSQLVKDPIIPKKWKVMGDPTEGALLELAIKMGVDVHSFKIQHPPLFILPFNPESKMMATQHFINQRGIVFLKGAPEIFVNYCDTIYDGESGIELTEDLKSQIKLASRQMGKKSLRVLAIGVISDNLNDDLKNFSQLWGKVSLIGLVGELDPPRKEVYEAVKKCLAAGIKPVMLTGDHKITAQTIAQTLGILRDESEVISGDELDLLSDDLFSEKIDDLRVFARVHPAQKLRIVETFQKKGYVVAMTGDGVNDAPALVRADVGVAMGLSGTEVAKEASKIIITDDNFATIVEAVYEGRLVYQNIKKLILFLFVTSMDEVIILFLALFMGLPIPLTAVHILWINLVTEGVLTVNLIMEPAEGDEMLRPPVSVEKPLLDRSLLSRVPLMVATSVISTFGWFIFRSNQGISEDLLRTETFTILAVCQWFNVLNCRSATRSVFSRDFIKNPWLIAGLLLANFLHLSIIYFEPLGELFRTVPIPPREFFFIGAVASLVLWAEELRKFLKRQR